MRILYLDPVGQASFVGEIADSLAQVSRPDTQIDVISLQPDRPRHIEYHAYEALIIADLVRITYALNKNYDAIVIGCFYDVGLREVREVSGKAVVTAPCQSTTAIASQLGNTFSVLVGRRKWIPKMSENVRLYGHDHAMVSMRPLEIGVLEFQQDHDYTCDRMIVEGRKAVEEDGAEVIILGCTAEFGFHETLQDELGVPVIDAILAPFKYAEMLGETAKQFGWYPSRKWGSEAPPQDEIDSWGLFHDDLPEIKTLVSAKAERELA
ncbi:MAG: hydantoin racemase [Chloroflexi bacterium]|nr:MAG: hydantoin racemase [Chloroflexota bacterium]